MVVDDEPQVLRMLGRVLGKGYDVVACRSGQEALERFAEHEIAVIITDHSMPQMSGFDLLKALNERFADSFTVRVVLSAAADLEVLGDFVNECRIAHFIPKPFSVPALREVVAESVDAYRLERSRRRRAERLRRKNERLKQENERLKAQLGQSPFGVLIGNSRALRDVLARAAQVVRSDVTVHLSGETGTGKELVSRAIAAGGRRADGPFVAQNCAGLDGPLLQSTLFGHKKGSFTGAEGDHRGVFQQADGGTLLLDEVAELSLKAQAALLRTLQEGEVVPVGATEPERVDVRLISATHVDLAQRVREGRFREDLYYRLVVVNLTLPPLRARVGDIPVLTAHFYSKAQQRHQKELPPLPAALVRALEAYSWPGNVRELANEVERLVVLAENGTAPDHSLLSPRVVDGEQRLTANADAEGVFIPFGTAYDEAHELLSRRLIRQALAESGGVIRAAADSLNMDKSRLAKLRRRLRVPVAS